MKCSHYKADRKRCCRKVQNKGDFCWQHNKSTTYTLRGGGRGARSNPPKGLKPPRKGSWTIYGHEDCPYTDGAVRYLSEEKHIFYNIAEMWGKSIEDLRSFLVKYRGDHRTMPFVFDKKGKFVGGYSDLTRINLKNF